MAQPVQLKVRDVGLKCLKCETCLPMFLNPWPFPGVYFCPNCNQDFVLEIEEMEIRRVDEE